MDSSSSSIAVIIRSVLCCYSVLSVCFYFCCFLGNLLNLFMVSKFCFLDMPIYLSSNLISFLCRIAEDADLRLGPKLAAAVGKEALPELPKPSHLDTRANGLLRQIARIANRPPKPPRGPTAGGRGRGPTPAAPVATRREPSAAAVAAFLALSARCESALGEETCTLIRKLRTLQRKGSEMEPSIVVNKTKKYLNSIGKRIMEVGKTAEMRSELWAYVSEYTENASSGEKLEHVFLKLTHHGQSHAAAEGPTGAAGKSSSGGGVKHEVKDEVKQEDAGLAVAGTGAPPPPPPPLPPGV